MLIYVNLVCINVQIVFITYGAYHVCECESRMTQFQVFQERVQFAAVQRAPGAV